MNLEPQSWALIAIGSNEGNSIPMITESMARLQSLGAGPFLRSSLWRTAPVDCPPGSPPFLNAAVALIPIAGETPETLLAKLQALEKEFGRQPKRVMNEARPLDLDLIAFGLRTRSGEQLTLPHPRAHLRRFVLAPLNEIVPEFILPGQARPIGQLLADLPVAESVERVVDSTNRALPSN